MKTLFALLLIGFALTSGCATPAYSGHERFQMITRNMNYEGKMINDDIDSLLLLRPASRLTIWHVR